MRHFKADNQYVVVLQKGEDLHQSLSQFAKEADLAAAWLQGLGAALELEIGYYDLEAKAYKWKQFQGSYEITGMQGNIVGGNNGQPLFHIHGTFSDTECRAYGGHVHKLIVGGTCEILVRPLDAELSRQTDEFTGLNLLCQTPEH